MKHLVVNIQPLRSSGRVTATMIRQLAGEGGTHRFSNDDGPCLQITFRAEDPRGLWSLISAMLAATPALASACIVTCEGERGWDDALLLHHFDPLVPLYDLPWIAGPITGA